jgi:hypothetical protein
MREMKSEELECVAGGIGQLKPIVGEPPVVIGGLLPPRKPGPLPIPMPIDPIRSIVI